MSPDLSRPAGIMTIERSTRTDAVAEISIISGFSGFQLCLAVMKRGSVFVLSFGNFD